MANSGNARSNVISFFDYFLFFFVFVVVDVAVVGGGWRRGCEEKCCLS